MISFPVSASMAAVIWNTKERQSVFIFRPHPAIPPCGTINVGKYMGVWEIHEKKPAAGRHPETGVKCSGNHDAGMDKKAGMTGIKKRGRDTAIYGNRAVPISLINAFFFCFNI